MKMTEEQVRLHQMKNNLPCALESVQSAQAQAVASALASPAQERWQAGEEKKLNELVCIELKAHGGRLSQHQRECIDDLKRSGIPTLVSYSFPEAIDFAVNHLHLIP